MTIYLDYASYYPPKQAVLNYFLESLEYSVNPASSHFMGYRSKIILNKAKKRIQDIYNCEYDDKIIFTSGATEANNTAISLFSDYIEQYIIGSTEHPSVSMALENKKNVKVVMVKDGVVDLKELSKYLSNNKRSFVSIMMLNNETGVITQNIKEAIDLTHKYNGIFHSDCAQAGIKMLIDIRKLNIDMISLSSAKVGAISGVGALMIKNRLLLSMKASPLIRGSGYQDKLRSGTPSVALIDAFAYALKLGVSEFHMQDKKFEKIMDLIVNSLKHYSNMYIIGTSRCNSILYISNSYTSKLEQVAFFDQHGICVSPGTACSKGGGVYSDKFIMSQSIIDRSGKIITANDINSAEFKKIKNIYNTGIRLSFGHLVNNYDINSFLKALHKMNSNN